MSDRLDAELYDASTPIRLPQGEPTMATPTTFIFDMGDRVRDVVNGYEGVIIGRFEYWTGCNHYGVEAATTDGGSKVPYESVDEQRLELVKAAAVTLPRRYADKPAVRTSPGSPAARSPQRSA